MSRALILFNPHSDRGRSSQKAAELRSLIDQVDHTDWRATEYAGHATQLAASAAEQGYDRVIALGGDGTVHEVINGLMRAPAAQRPRLGIVPIGTGNDFAHAAGIASNRVEAARRALNGSPHPIDVIAVRDDQGRLEYFNNTAGVGFDAAINIQTRRLRYVYGFMMYFTATLWTLALWQGPPRLRVSYQEGVFEQPVTMLTLGNGPREGGGFLTTPGSKVDDGRFEFVYIGDVSRWRIAQLIPKVMNGTHIHERDIRMISTTQLTVESQMPLPIHLDGELFASYESNVRRVEFKLEAGAVQLMV